MDEWNSVHASNYQSKAFWDIHWIRNANDLLESASLLRPKITELWDSYRKHSKDKKIPFKSDHYQGVYFMLLAYAVENLFKAAIVRKKSCLFKQQFKEDKIFPKELKNHDLVKLANQAKFETTLEDEDLLRRLTRSAIWYGRYPVPLSYKKMSGSEKFSDGKNYSVSWFGGNDLERVDSLVFHLKQFLRQN